ncbi:hypothetical protein M8J76_004994 [Diaphorina citri]|nr:hypothetical protein M8J75_011407 [Diaphorina citri]KAI5713762.1 hypothetical protein M8J76_004994 [Diaphorina citri]
MAKSRNGLISAGITVLGFFFLLLAFTSHSWVVSNGRIQDPQFQSIGLWSICLTGFEEFHHWYDTKFYGCWWVFEEEYYIIHDFLFPGFFISTQIFMLMCFLASLVSTFLVALYMCCSRTQEKFILLLRVISGNAALSAFTGTIALIIFGIYGDSRDWLPHWESNDIGWAYYSAVCGVLLNYTAAILYFIESRAHTIKKRKTLAAQSAYHMEQRRDLSHHTEI